MGSGGPTDNRGSQESERPTKGNLPVASPPAGANQHPGYSEEIQDQPTPCLSTDKPQHTKNLRILVIMNGIPKRVLTYLVRRGLLSEPPSPEEIHGLRFLESIWGDKEVIRAQMARMSRQARRSFVQTVGLAAKWERYAYSRFRNNGDGRRLSMTRVVLEIESTFGFVLNRVQVKQLYRLRNRAYAAKHREKNSRLLSYLAQTKKE